MTTPNGSGITNRGTDYEDGSQVTSGNINEHVDNAVFNTNAVDDTTIGLNSSTPKALFVKNAGIDTAQLKDNAVTTLKITDANVTTAKIADSNVTLAKIENIADNKVLANTTGSAAAPVATDVIDSTATLASNNNDTSIPTSGAVMGLFTLSGSDLTINI